MKGKKGERNIFYNGLPVDTLEYVGLAGLPLSLAGLPLVLSILRGGALKTAIFLQWLTGSSVKR